jgi:quinolinate synthase
VVAVADFVGSTAAMSDYVAMREPPWVVLLTECSMSLMIVIAALHVGKSRGAHFRTDVPARMA